MTVLRVCGLRTALIAPALIALALITLAGCRGGSGQRTDAPRSVRDDFGRAVQLPRVPQRIVSLAPSITETLYAIGAGDAVVGVTSYCNYPAGVAAKQRVGDMLAPDIERIVALKPDLVVLSVEGNRRETFDALTRLGLTCFVTQPRTLAGVLGSIRMLGAVMQSDARAAALADSLEALRASVVRSHAKLPRVRALMLLSIQPLMSVGAHSFLDEIIRAAGGENAGVARDVRYPVIGREDVIARDPDVLLLPDDLGVTDATLTGTFPEWSRLSAVRAHHVLRVHADLFLRPGPRVFEGLRVIAAVLDSVRAR